ncbi:MAG: hypothetical protein COB36_09840 [Alphaproteobacteria bacterium]|nr:MAG: hypothetical protein COB36_09840 [Alphaproteobacteria bacterium]
MISSESAKTNSSLFGGLSLALLSTTCCALPIVLVALGMGSAVASLVSTLPWLVFLSEYKIFTFGMTGLILGYCFWRLRQVEVCEIADLRRLKVQRAMLWTSTTLLLFSIFAAYALLPITMWLENGD